MARTKTRAERIAELKEKILQCMVDGLDTTPAIAAKLRWKRSGISTCLEGLEKAGKVHHIRIGNTGKGGYVNRWFLGQRPEGAVVKPEPRRGDRAVIRLTSTYPVVGIRDPLVAALFGAPVFALQAPNQSAPRCTACGIEQGAGHAANCLVALVAA